MCNGEKKNTQSSEVTIDAELWACWVVSLPKLLFRQR